MHTIVLVPFLLCLHLAHAQAQSVPAKLIVPNAVDVTLPGDASLLADYGSYHLYAVDPNLAAQLAGQYGGRGVRLLDNPDLLQFEARTFDTQRDALSAPAGFGFSTPTGPSLHMIQFVGPVKQEWLNELIVLGAQPVHYVANNGYLVWADEDARQRLALAAGQGNFIQFADVYHSFFKLDRNLSARLQRGDDLNTVVPVVVQLYGVKDGSPSKATIEALSDATLANWETVLSFENGRFRMPLSAIESITDLPDVYRVEEILPRERFDEVQNQIIAGEFNGGMTGPANPGYLSVLSSYGFPTSTASYPVVDVVDDGIGTGSVNSGDDTLHEFGQAANPTRLQFVSNCTSSANGAGPDGHGHINVSIVGGYDDNEGAGFPFEDPNGYLRGVGVNPFAPVAGTRIFDPGFDLSSCGNTDTGLIRHTQDQGAQISTNSWGCASCSGSYDTSSQAFDVGVRDADLSEAGNQEMMHLFAAGNSGSGSGTIGSPGNGKNMLTVGASENARPSDEDGNWTDGCGVGPSGADSAMDIIGFSSRGPAPGGRIKPETIAPGTHIQGTASTNAGYNGSGVCDQFRPSGQTRYAASSGTSHSTPAVAGLTSLVWWWLENEATITEMSGTRAITGTPSPALLKAYLLAHPTYLTGVSANDTLPSNNQGFGMPNMSLLFNSVPKGVVNQSVTFDNSGESWQFMGSVADNTEPLRIMLVYTDAPGATGTSPQVNDLNLTVTVGGNTYNGNVFSGQWSATGGGTDALNNYEGVFLPPGTSGPITVDVSAFNIAGDGVPNSGDGTDQDFALVCSNCAQTPTFSLDVTPTSLGICAGDDAQYMVDVGSVLGFSDPVTLSVSGAPGGTTTSFTANPVNPPGGSMLTVGATGGASVGSYTLTIEGSGGGEMDMFDVGLDIASAVPGAPTLAAPVDGASGVSLVPTLSWSPVAGVSDYLVEVATDPSFLSIVYSATESGTSHTLATGLVSDNQYYWRVTAQTPCGAGQSTTFDFTTMVVPGSCPGGLVSRTYLFEDMESGAPGWTHSGTQDTWTLSTASANSGTMSFHATDLASVSDQYLISPSAVLPAGLSDYRLRFFNEQIIEDRTGGCYDGAVLEISTNGGGSWTRIGNAELLTDTYDGPISGSFGSPLAGDDAWCGDPQAWLDSVVDLDAYAGQTVRFRFRLATDVTVGREGWYIDDVRVQACEMPVTNNPPTPVADSYTVDEDQTLNATDVDGTMNGDPNDDGVLANDSDPEMDPLVVGNAGSFAAGGIGGTVNLNADGTFAYTPPPNQSGMATFVYLADDGMAQTPANVTINVMPVEDPPMLTVPGPQMTLEDTALVVPTISVSDVDTASLEVTLGAFAGTMTLASTSGLVVSGDGTQFITANGTAADLNAALDGLVYDPLPDQFTMDQIGVTLDDGVNRGGADVTDSIDINIVGVNDPPTFTPGGNVTLLEDAGSQMMPWASAISAGPSEFGQSVSFMVSVTGTTGSLAFSSAPAIDASGNLSFTTAAQSNGTATVEVVAMDDGGTANGGSDQSGVATFMINVTAVNDPPGFIPGGDVTVNEDSGGQSSLWATAISPGPADESGQNISFTAQVTGTTGNLTFDAAPAVDAAGNLTYTPTTESSGTATVAVFAEDDGGTADGGNDTSPTEMFTIIVNEVNDAPSFMPGADVNVLEDSGMYSMAWATGISVGPPGETGQTVTFDVSVIGTTGGLTFSGQPAIDATGVLSFTPDDDAVGSATLEVFAEDDGGTAYGGDDTSATETFTITVGSVNDPPVFTPGGDVHVLEDSGAYSMAWASAISAGPGESAQNVSFDVSVIGTAGGLTFSAQPAVDAAGILTFTPAGNSNGSASVEIFAMDDGGTADGGDDTSATETFTITVGAVNDPPGFGPGADVNVLEDSGAYSMTWATGVTAGPADESGQTVAFNLSVTGTSGGLMFSVPPAIDAAGVLTFTPAADSNGSAMLDVIAMDDGGTANGGDDTSATVPLTITITAVNDAPSFTPGGDVMVLEGTGPYSAPWASGLTTGPANETGQSLSFNLTGNTNPALFVAGPSVDNTGVLTFEPAAGVNGASDLTVELMDDGGIADGGVDTSAPETFTITVTSAGDLAISKISDSVWTPTGGMLVYTIGVSNNGPSDVSGATVLDTPPARLGNLQWTCVPTIGANCTASGSGPINEQVDIDAGEMVTFTLMADLLDMDETPVTNTASVSAPAETPDPNLGNNTDSDTDLIGMYADSFESVER